MADTANTVVDLQQVLAEERAKREQAENYAKALAEEFASCSDFEAVRTKFRESIRDFAPQALLNIVALANSAESESVRANLNKWILDWAMSEKLDGSSNEIKNLLEKLKANDGQPQPQKS